MNRMRDHDRHSARQIPWEAFWRSALRYQFAITTITLSICGMAITAAAAPYIPKSGQCYSACLARCGATLV